MITCSYIPVPVFLVMKEHTLTHNTVLKYGNVSDGYNEY